MRPGEADDFFIECVHADPADGGARPESPRQPPRRGGRARAPRGSRSGPRGPRGAPRRRAPGDGGGGRRASSGLRRRRSARLGGDTDAGAAGARVRRGPKGLPRDRRAVARRRRPRGSEGAVGSVSRCCSRPRLRRRRSSRTRSSSRSSARPWGWSRALGAAVLAELRDRSVKGPEDLAETLPFPILAEIPLVRVRRPGRRVPTRGGSGASVGRPGRGSGRFPACRARTRRTARGGGRSRPQTVTRFQCPRTSRDTTRPPIGRMARTTSAVSWMVFETTKPPARSRFRMRR